MKSNVRRMASAFALLSAAILSQPSHAASTGTVQGTVTNQQGALLNGVCGHLLSSNYTSTIADFAPTGTSGQPGFYTQANIAPGRYLLLFTDCGTNINGGPIDYNYVPTFYGGGITPSKAQRISVPGGVPTSLNPQQIPLGGTVTGTITDANTKQPANTIAVGVLIPNDSKFNLNSPFSWLIVCSDPSGNYSVSGVPTAGVRIAAAPTNWGCFDPNNFYNANFWKQKLSNIVSTTPDSTTSAVNLRVTETTPPPAALTMIPPPSSSGPWKLLGVSSSQP